MNGPVTIKFTKTEGEILIHRLEVPDALAECLSEDGFESGEVYFTAGVLKQQIMDGTVFETDDLSPLDKAILKDCCDGSTYFADAEDAVASGEISRGKLMAEQKAALSLERKLKSIGIEVNIPNF